MERNAKLSKHLLKRLKTWEAEHGKMLDILIMRKQKNHIFMQKNYNSYYKFEFKYFRCLSFRILKMRLIIEITFCEPFLLLCAQPYAY